MLTYFARVFLIILLCSGFTLQIMIVCLSVVAYIGDVVFELYIRSRHVWPQKRTSDLQNMVVAIVRGKYFLSYANEKQCVFSGIHSLLPCFRNVLVYSGPKAEHQVYLLEQLKSTFQLTDKEKQILMRGRNAVTRSKNRRNPAAYQNSTSFEAFIGYLYIRDQGRCGEVLSWLDDIVDKVQ